MEENTKKPLTLSGTLGLKKPLSGSQIRQTVGGQSKFVQVEVRKKRTIGGTTPAPSVLSDASQAQKLKLLMEAKKLEEVKAKKRAEEEALRAKEREEERKQQELVAAEQEAAKRETARKEAEKKASAAADAPSPEKSNEKAHGKDFKKKYEDDGEVSFKDRKKSSDEQIMPSKKGKGADERRRSGKINLSSYMSGDDDDDDGWGQKRGRSLASIRRAREKEKLKHTEAAKPAEKISRKVTIPETITVQELANRMAE